MRLKYIREEAELKQKDVASLLGVSRSVYAMWETEHDIIPILRLNNFCNLFKVSLDYVLELTDNKTYPDPKKEIDQNKLAKRLKDLRIKNHLTQDKLSQKLNITRSLISKYENNNQLILTSFLMEYSKFFNISCDYLIGKIDEEITLKELSPIA